MASLQITIEIADEPDTGYRRQKMDRVAGADTGAILSRIASANRATYPSHGNDDKNVVHKAVAAAVQAAEA